MGMLLGGRANVLAALSLSLCALPATSAPASKVGAAPPGDATMVATKIIRANHDSCKKVTKAARQADGSIRATCSGTAYMVFTLFDAKKGVMHEVALNCDAAKKLLNVSC